MSGWHTTSRHTRGYGHQWDKLRAAILEYDDIEERMGGMIPSKWGVVFGRSSRARRND